MLKASSRAEDLLRIETLSKQILNHPLAEEIGEHEGNLHDYLYIRIYFTMGDRIF